MKFAVDASGVPYEDIPLLRLFTRLMTDTGAGEYSDVELSRRIGTHTGGVSANLMQRSLRPDDVPEGTIHDRGTMMTKIMIGGKATSDKVDELLSIFALILTESKLDSQSKVIEVLKETKTRMESSIQSSGHSYANTRMKARYSVNGYLDEYMGGISYLDFVKDTLKQAEEDWDSLLARLENIRKVLLDSSTCRNGMFVDITGDKNVLEKVQPKLETFLSKLPGDANGSKLQDFYNEEHPWCTTARKEMAENAPLKDEGFVVPTQVSYVGKGGKLFDAGESVPGSSIVVSKFLRTGYLWDHVRVIGGAYGGFCTFDAKGGDGVFTYLSYRDPNLEKTIDVYDNTPDALFAAAKHMEEKPEALATAIIGAMSDLDGALSPDQKGATALNRWIARESPEQRQKFRDEVLNTKAEDFKIIAERLKGLQKPSVAVVSSKAAFEAAAEAGKVMDLTEVA